jgi:hypothetical protein
MGKWSEDIKELRAEMKLYQIEECADALIDVLEAQGATEKGIAIRWKELEALIPEQIQKNRRCNGVLEIPTLYTNNGKPREIQVIGEAFVRSQKNRKKIRFYCEEYGFYIIWELGGIRLGTLEEYMMQQCQVSLTSQAMIDFHNERAEIIREHGKDADELIVRLKERRAKNGR